MRKRKQQVTMDNLTLTVSAGGGYFDRIPVDLLIQILSRLLCVKSLAKCRCVCKLWSSIIRRPNYNHLFPINSPDPPRLLFTFVFGENLWFYSAPQPEDNNPYVTATLHHTYSRPTQVSQTCPPVRGLVCHQRSIGVNHIVAVISNPITGQSVTSPKVKTEGFEAKNYFGYDPIGNKFKVLCLTWSKRGTLQHQVLTVETGKVLLWRKIPCCISYFPLHDGICINGVLYYTASDNIHMIVCFNVRSEKFDFITGGLSERSATLVNYKGKLGAVETPDYDDDNDNGFVLWVLEDAEEHKWSKHILVTPLPWNTGHVVAVGVTNRGEIVLSPKYAEVDPFYIYYYNRENNTMVRVRVIIPGFELLKWYGLDTFPNYVEDVKLM